MVNAAADKITCGELLDDRLENVKANIKAFTAKIWNWYVEANIIGVRLGELLAWEWSQVDLKHGFVTLNVGETKSGHSRASPILKGDMYEWFTQLG